MSWWTETRDKITGVVGSQVQVAVSDLPSVAREVIGDNGVRQEPSTVQRNPMQVLAEKASGLSSISILGLSGPVLIGAAALAYFAFKKR